MGWLFYAHTRKDLIADRIKGQETEHATWKTLKHCAVGNTLWYISEITVKQTGETTRHIFCDLLQKNHGKWGYKDLSESMGPYYYSCPLAYLAMVPVENATWRESVIQYHAKQQAKRKKRASIFCPIASMKGI